MRSFVFAIKIAFLFAVMLAVVLGGALALFVHVFDPRVLHHLGRLQALEGADVAELVEAHIAAEDGWTAVELFENPELRRILDGEGKARGLRIFLQPVEEPIEGPNLRRSWVHRRAEGTVTVRGRRIPVQGPPVVEAHVPIHHRDRQVAWLVLRGSQHVTVVHNAFLAGLSHIGLVALAAGFLLAWTLTRPLRRMRRSMDRIADGDLEHRAPASGRDEVAAMGRSFNAMADRIQSMLTGQRELLAAVSHELRSPLARMKLSLELLRSRGGDDPRIDQVETEIDAVDALVGEILLASRFELGEVPLSLRHIDLADLCQEAWRRVAWDRLDSDAESRGISLAVETGDGAEALRADPSLASRILGNLFQNAVRYAGRGTVRVTSKRVMDPPRIEITVADDGPEGGSPLDAAQLDRLFEPFYRADPSRAVDPEGAHTGAVGLGLMVVKRAVEAHGGRIRAEPAKGGLAVTFDLPAGPRPAAVG
ncbi:MAG: HAMP domain-containing sensor histidine kinase [Acidobacteriota bacterium]